MIHKFIQSQPNKQIFNGQVFDFCANRDQKKKTLPPFSFTKKNVMVGVATPRVSASTVGLYPNTVVRVVGRANMGDTILQTGDGPINIRKPPGATFPSSGIFEVVGTVNQDGSVTENSFYDWKEIGMFTKRYLSHCLHFIFLYIGIHSCPSSLDMEVYNNMLTVYQKYSKEIFL
jgi:Replication factor A protein 3